jgi:hypothetical protein
VSAVAPNRLAAAEVRALIPLIFAVTLTGCVQSKEEDMKACVVQADHFFGEYGAFDFRSPRSQFIIGCMITKGYDFDITPDDCDSHHPLPSQTTCYSASGWLDWLNNKFNAD